MPDLSLPEGQQRLRPPVRAGDGVRINLENCTQTRMALIKLTGYGDKYSRDGDGEPIAIDWQEGEPVRLLVWADINQDDPTHTIDLTGALESNRTEE